MWRPPPHAPGYTIPLRPELRSGYGPSRPSFGRGRFPRFPDTNVPPLGMDWWRQRDPWRRRLPRGVGATPRTSSRKTPHLMTHSWTSRRSTLSPVGTSWRPRPSEEVMTMSDRLLRRREVENITGMSRSSIYRLMQEGEFPRPVRVGSAAVRWRASDITLWLESRRP